MKKNNNRIIRTSAEYEDWINRRWRPAIAWQYIVVCLFDFLIAPSFNFYYFAFYESSGAVYSQWQAITLSSSGLYHIAMGAIIGVTAWQRGEEKKLRYSHNEENNDREETRSRQSNYTDPEVR